MPTVDENYKRQKRESGATGQHVQPGQRHVDRVAKAVLDAAYRVHMRLGPGLTEKVYETLLEHYLLEGGHTVVRQKRIPFEVDGVKFKEGLRPDLIVDGVLIVEVKSAKEIAAVDWKQVLTYLRVLDLEVGLLLNFGCATMKEGIRRVVNSYKP
jgi:GxxExxY protein